MALKRVKVDLSIEKSILTGMIISDRFLREILPIYNPTLLEIEFAPIIAKWCIRHFDKYEKAPAILIKDVFEAWRRSNPNAEQSKYIEIFLNTLSDEYEHSAKFNADYLMDKTLDYFKGRSLKILSEDISYYLEQDDLEGAEQAHSEYRKIEKITSPGIDVFDDEDAWRDAFADNSDVLFTVPGKLGKMLNEEFRRDTFVSLMGVAKIGKTWNMNFLAHQAVRARCNVAMFQAGDLSQGQMMVRNGIYITQRSNKPKYCGVIKIPVLDCVNNQKDICENPKRLCKFGCYDTDGNILEYENAVGYVPCTNCYGNKGNFKGTVWHELRRPVRPLTWQEAYKAAQEYKLRMKAKRFKLSTHSSKSLNVAGIIQQLNAWERIEGWVPDVILIDYADILAPERKGNKEARDDINETWMALRGLSQNRHCCVITATQANGMAIKEKSTNREHYAGDRRKYDHVTAMFSLSQTAEEKRQGVTRWGALVIREDDWDEDYHVNVLGCLAIGRPYLNSF
jgi:hypothetical protein